MATAVRASLLVEGRGVGVVWSFGLRYGCRIMHALPDNGLPSTRRLRFLAVGFFVAAALAMLVDMPIARLTAAGKVPGDLRRLIAFSEVFAHGMGVLMILLAMHVLAPARRPEILRLACTAFGAGLLAVLLKLIVVRMRPRAANLDVHVLDTFGAWFPLFNESVVSIDSSIQAMPSGHAATAVGLAIGLVKIFPHGRYFFAGLAVLAAVQRIDSSAHFLSDTLAGAGIGCLVAAAMHDVGGVGARFDRWEKRTH